MELQQHIVTTATSSLTIRTTAPTSRQSMNRISDVDKAAQAARRPSATAAEAGGGGNSSREEGGKWDAHTIRPPPTATPIAVPGRQKGPTATSTLSKSVLQAFLGSAARGISLCETTPTRSPPSHSRRERSSLKPSPSKPKWRRRRWPSHSAQLRQQRRRGGAFALDHLLRVLNRSFSL